MSRSNGRKLHTLESNDRSLLGHLSDIRALEAWPTDCRHSSISREYRADAASLGILNHEEETFNLKFGETPINPELIPKEIDLTANDDSE
jgi:hypothetical protein